MAQNKVIGRYRDHFGNRIQLSADSTFKYTWNFDMAASWTKGTWTLKKDTVIFQVVPIYDTVTYNNLRADTLILSDDETSDRIIPIRSVTIALSGGGQNRISNPSKLLFKKGRLYKIQNESLVVKRQKGFGTSKKLNPWYFKSDD
jgi:hypothetical protein